MSFALPSLKVKEQVPDNFEITAGSYGIPNQMISGLHGPTSNDSTVHPLAPSEKNYLMHKDKLNMTILRNTQGLHAPLRLAMEKRSAEKIGRLPFLPSSQIMLETLTGRDMALGPEDIFNTGEFYEKSGQPHAMVEKSLGLL